MPVTVPQPIAEIGVEAVAVIAPVSDGFSVATSESTPDVVSPCVTWMFLTNSTEPAADTVPDFQVTGPVVCVPSTYAGSNPSLGSAGDVVNDATENVRPAPVICSTSVMVAVALFAGPARLETVPVSVATMRPEACS